MAVTRTSGLLIPSNHPTIDIIRSDLTRTIEDYNGDIRTVNFFQPIGNDILIPRFYPVKDQIIDDSSDGANISIEHHITPRTDRQRDAMEYLESHNSGVLQLEPGSGKTVVAIRTVATYKKRSIIFAHKDKLLDQWKAEFLEFTNLQDSDIVRLSSNNYKDALAASIILSTPHVIARAVSDNKIEFLTALTNANIGIVLVDECHVGVGPEKFSLASLSIPARRSYGLSATPERSDGMSDIIEYHLGKTITFQAEEGELTSPNVFMLTMAFGVYKRNQYFHYGGRFQLGRYYQQLYKSERYNKTLGGWIKKAYQDGRTILVLGSNIKPLLILAAACDLPKSDVGIFIPGAVVKEHKKLLEAVTDNKDLDIAFKERKVVFSTYGACRDGNNRPELDFLVMVTPTTNIDQAVGRILRKLEGKRKPIVLDVVDTEGPEVVSIRDGVRTQTTWFMRSARNRYDKYKKNGWSVKITEIKNA